ncbi:hypothetical protein F5146DRAFT_1157626, partial [Armillaria mellea]
REESTLITEQVKSGRSAKCPNLHYHHHVISLLSLGVGMIGTYTAELQALYKDMRDMFVALLCLFVSYIYCASFSACRRSLKLATATPQSDGSSISTLPTELLPSIDLPLSRNPSISS